MVVVYTPSLPFSCQAALLQVAVWVVAAVYNIPILLMFDTMSTSAGAFCYMTLPLMDLVSNGLT